MGERKGTNKYYPPDFDPAKHGSLNGYHKTHALRERARKLSQGILIIRFEMPYNIWCDGCKNHIGMGVRYNAEKKKVGNYYTTPIYRFRMKCHLCVNYIEMQTDPATCDYVIVSGASRKEERWDMAENEQILTTERAEKEKLETDAMYKLDHGGKDKQKLNKALPSLSEIQDMQSRWIDDFQLNSALRRKFRTEKTAIAEKEEKDNAVRMRTNLSIPLLPEKEEDKKLAALLTYQAPDSYDEKQHSKRKEISSRSWFKSNTSSSAGAAASLLHKLGQQAKQAAMTKASTSQLSPLIRKRSTIKAETCATITQRKSHVPMETCEGMKSSEAAETSAGVSLNRCEAGVETGRDVKVTHEENKELMHTENMRGKEEHRGGGGLSSLVADYTSDSASDSEH
ncbi:coiled-coil domain-containing protein 130 homolog [Gouania willdenowi]|uniref:Probable splicing factor YJU2B n=1 Tax=Gouania willdenowi TaxID=441366 RepID=A0A8C5DD10_GOUWI|nr:coiled-coil domain-containing protein 130 homolog [Gouania willdenowi]XP_028315220.1 coiled-coil domain-containing protein 130 homolog [Gouania willdenowi]